MGEKEEDDEMMKTIRKKDGEPKTKSRKYCVKSRVY